MRRSAFWVALALVLVLIGAAVLGNLLAAGAGDQLAALPTYTPYPTYTPLPTYTPYPTYTPLPTAAAQASPTAGTPAASATRATPARGVITPTVDPELPPDLGLLTLLNSARATDGCTATLRLEPRLERAAQAHAEDMAGRGEIDHVGADGATYQERLDRVGYAYVRRGENIAAGYTKVEEIFAAWMDEPPDGPHRTNILNCAYRHAGVGLALRDDGYHYWVLDMAEPRAP